MGIPRHFIIVSDSRTERKSKVMVCSDNPGMGIEMDDEECRLGTDRIIPALSYMGEALSGILDLRRRGKSGIMGALPS
jgi:hypothetical protein